MSQQRFLNWISSTILTSKPECNLKIWADWCSPNFQYWVLLRFHYYKLLKSKLEITKSFWHDFHLLLMGGGFKHLHMSNERFYVKIIEMVSSIGYPMIQILGTCTQMQSLPIGASTSSFCYIKQGVCHTVALRFTLKSILRQKKNYWNSNISPCKDIIFKKSSKRNQNASRYYNSILTNLKFQHKPKHHLSKITT